MAKVTRTFSGNSRGIGLIEVIIALAILGIVAVAFLSGLSTSFKAVFISDERSTAQALATSEMEYVKSQDYPSSDWDYTLTHDTITTPSGWPSEWVWVWDEANPPLSEDYAGYCVHVQAEEIATDLRKITVTVYHSEQVSEDEKVLELEDYKVNR